MKEQAFVQPLRSMGSGEAIRAKEQRPYFHQRLRQRSLPGWYPTSLHKITEMLLSHFKKIAPPSVTIHAFEHHGGEPYMTPIDSKGYQAASKALQTTFGKIPIPVRGGGSIPICSILEKELGTKIIFMGFGLDNDNLHSPNEKFNLENYYKGIETIPYFHKFFAQS